MPHAVLGWCVSVSVNNRFCQALRFFSVMCIKAAEWLPAIPEMKKDKNQSLCVTHPQKPDLPGGWDIAHIPVIHHTPGTCGSHRPVVSCRASLC